MQSVLSALETELLWALEDQEGVNSLLSFIPRTSPGYTEPTHLTRLAEAFLRAEREPVRLCVATPPRHAKTESILHFCVRYLKRYPSRKIAYVTHSQNLSNKWSRKAMRLADSAGLQLSVKNLNRWSTAAGGEFLFSSIKGGLVGNGYDLIIVDDPYKNRGEAESATINDSIYEVFKDAARTRLEPNGSIVVCHHRWTLNDLIGRLLEEDYEDLTLPAISTDGKALWPERWSLEALETAKLEMTSSSWASLYMGSPVARDGVLFGVEAARYKATELEAILSGANLVLAVDPAATASTKADYSVIAVIASKGVGVDQRYWLVDLWRGQVTVPDLVKHIQEVQKRWRAKNFNAPIYVEGVGGFKAVGDTLRAIDPSLKVEPAPVTADKYTRALPLAAAWEHQRFFLPEVATWLTALVTEFKAFTGKNDPHDDIVDACAHAVAALRRSAPARRGLQVPHWT